MKKFKFQLQIVLKLRKIEEEQAQVALRQAVDAYMLTIRKLEELTSNYKVNQQRLLDLQQEQRPVDDFLKFIHFLSQLEHQINRQKQEVLLAKQVREQRRGELEEATRQRKIVETLREKKFREYQHELLREEQNFLDELGTQRYVRDDGLING